MRWAPVIFFAVFPLGAHAQAGSGGWPFAGFDLNNSRWASQEATVGVTNAASLTARWSFKVPNDVSATPSVDSTGAVYFPDWSGNIWKLNGSSGAVIWKQTVKAYGFPAAAISRTTPTLAGNLVLIGVSSIFSSPVHVGAYLAALDPSTGALIWKTALDSSAIALATGSAIVYNNIAYVGVSSAGETQPDADFRGSVVAISLPSGRVLWKTYMVPTGYTGAAVWSGTPVIDLARNQLYVTTGNNYEVPVSVQQCEEANAGNNPAILACQSSADYEDSIVALNLTTGAVVWARKCSVDDAFLAGCRPTRSGCPDPLGLDFDFGDGPHLFTATIGGQPTDLVGSGQKSGTFWALNPATGAIVWQTVVGPGGTLGGMEWGSASDNQRVYVAEANTFENSYKLQPSGVSWTGGSWAALDAASGAILWQVKDPGMSTVSQGERALTLGPVTVANGVVYCASMSGAMYGLNAATGATLWSFQAAGSVNAAPAVVNGWLYWGSGYHNFPHNVPIGTPSNLFYAFSLPQ